MNTFRKFSHAEKVFRRVRWPMLCGSLGLLLTASFANALPDPPAAESKASAVQGAPAGKQPAATPRSAEKSAAHLPRLRLAGGDFIVGDLRDCDKPGNFRVQPTQLLEPLNFPIAAVEKLEFPQADKQMKATGEYCFELAGGDLLFGKLLQLSPKEAEIDTELFGKLHIQTSLLRRVERWDGTNEIVYMGPNGLTDWEKVTEIAGREEGDIIVLDTDGATLHGNVGLPPKSVIELELTWSRKPNFTLSLGVDKLDSTVGRAFGLEVWDDEIVARRETLREADIATVAPLAFGAGGIRLMIFLDQVQGRMQVLTPAGKQLADLRVPERSPTPYTGLRLTNKRGEIRLERMRITRWRDAPTGEVKTDLARVHLTDASVVYGKIESFDAATGKVVVKGEKEPVTVEANRIASLHLPGADTPRADGVRLAYRNGTRISGSLLEVRGGKMKLKSAGITEDFTAPLAFLRSITVTQQDRTGSDPFGKFATFSAEGFRLRGTLVPRAAKDPTHAPFAWQPVLSTDAAVLQPGIAGRIDFGRTPRATSSTVGQVQVQSVLPAEALAEMRVLKAQQQNAVAVRPGQQTNLYLRTGDTIPCRVVRIDEQGLWIESTVTKAKMIPHEKIKAVELVPGARLPTVIKNAVPAQEMERRLMMQRRGMIAPARINSPRIDTVKRERLLMLPRMQKNNPPTQLIVATNGDMLRGRIVSMDDTQLHIELRLENRDVPRERLSQIIWLHPDEIEEAKPAAESGKPGDKPPTADKPPVVITPPPDLKPVADQKPAAEVKPQPPAPAPAAKTVPGFRVHVVRVDNTRLTFNAQRLTSEQLSGVTTDRLSGDNEILGACDAPLNDMRELLFGHEIETAASQLAYHRWKLHHAVDPLPDPDGDASGGANRTGTESKLVGQLAPDFELDLHSGGKFKLSSKKGTVVVLDFWASWCGPCMQALPQVHAAAEGLKGQGVELIAVNIEEAPEQVAAALKRLKIPATVALDADGKVAGRFGVQGIPRTFIIDREGKIARDYLGGSADFENEIHTALKAVLGITPPKAPAKP